MMPRRPRLPAPLLALGLLCACAPAYAQDSGASSAASTMTTYSLSGAKNLRPIRIGDDGVHTYIEWAPEQPFPAVFAVNARGAEEIVDGYMRGTLYTLDHVYPHLRFRLDREKADAKRNITDGESR